MLAGEPHDRPTPALSPPSPSPSLDCDLGPGAVVARCGGAAEGTARQGKARVLGECALEKKDEERVPRGMQSRSRRFLAKALGKLKLPLTRGGEACFLRLGN